jgi:cell wall-associated NlpC family hydrolase
MSQPRRRWRALVLVALGALPALAALTVPGRVEAAPSSAVASAVDAYAEVRNALVAAQADLSGAEAERLAAEQEVAGSQAALDRAESRLAYQRDRYATLSAEYYVRQGADDQGVNDSMYLALSGRRQSLDRAKDAEKAAKDELRQDQRTLDDRTKTAAKATERRDDARAKADRAGAEADSAIADTGARDLSAVSYLAYRDAAAGAAERHPQCRISAAVLAGIGRISSGHGRNEGATVDHLGRAEPALRGLRGARAADTDQGEIDGDPTADVAMGPMQITPAAWRTAATDGDGDGTADPDDIFDAAATTAEQLCAPGIALDTFTPLDRAVDRVVGEGQQSTVALGTARRYARTTELGMGDVPADPRALVSDGSPQFDVSDTNLGPGDVLGMIDWSMTRIGTPYSQCLGVDVRPQDPECPGGTNRFGAGFFDCSGFVSSAYRRIGIAVPVSTYAMEADARFMATQVADHIDLKVMQPGDVFLMDGHTGLYVGDGMIVHAIGVGLTYEKIPGWVANGTFAVLRPADLR